MGNYLNLISISEEHNATCPLTRQAINLQIISSPLSFYYETEKTGKVLFSDLAFNSAGSLSDEEKQIVAGICRNRTIDGKLPEMIMVAFLSQLKNQDIPYSFEGKCRHFLAYLYNHGGEQYLEHNMDSNRDSPITYSSIEEFERIIRILKKRQFIDYSDITEIQSTTLYEKLYITDEGISEIRKSLSPTPMAGIVNQEIEIGDPNIDRQIEHARKSFFGEHSTFESKRSACETLCFVLEPLREELKNIFSGDSETFFNIVNSFNVRHNKQRTMIIQHEEQLEWIFYSFLNTINTYYKLKNKLKNS